MLNLDSLGGLGVGGQQQDPNKPKNDLGQQDFLKLMITQMQNQDPFQPMENGEFLSQIAQFTMANGISEMQESFKQFQRDMASDKALRAASLVGREVLVESGTGHLAANGTLSGTVRAPQGLDNLTLNIYSQSGELVRKVQMGVQPSGDIPFQWDGRNDQGAAMPAGRYRVSAQTEIKGEPVTLATLMAAPVSSVQLSKGGQSPVLNLEGIGEMSLDAVRLIK